MRVFIVTFALLCAFAIGVAAQQASSSNDEPKEKKTKTEPAAKAEKDKEKKPSAEKAPEPGPAAEEQKAVASKPGTDKDKEEYDVTEVAPIVTHHQVTVDSKLLKYTATAGRLPIKRGDGKIEAEMFFVAYTLDGQNASKRPLTFAFNGGPGSATIWLHMGALGPKHVVLQPDGFLPPPPYHIADNPSTLLDKSDVVFVDAISTGFSRAANAELSKKFLGVKGDIEAFSEFIRLYLTRNERWSSPLFLFGESYGTTRAAGIAGNLADQGISFNGITLLSTALSFQTLVDNKSNDQPYILLVPTFTMIAGYHKKLPADLAQDMAKARQESVQWAATEYTQALAKGDALTAEERQKAIDQMARYTGLSKEVIDQANLRIDVPKFTHYLLLDQKLRVGRLDGRFTGPDPDGLLDTPFYDPTESAIMGPYTSVFNNYVRTELGYKTDMPYQVFPSDQNFFENTWNWGSGIGGFPDTATALRQAIVKNPYLKVMVMEGFYDLATPFYAADYTINHLNLNPQYRKNISFATYEAGHMVYLPVDGLKKLKTDEAGFMDKSLN
jgi:carboxypeptidase C (cathepsin A)